MQEWLFTEIYKFCFVFLRIGSALMLMPGYSNSYVNARIRLSLAIMISLVLQPFLTDYLPAPAPTITENLRLFMIEICYGILLGVIMQFLYFAINLCGNFAGQAIGFANAQMFDPTTQNQSIITETFLSLLAITVIFMTDLHHLMLSAVIDSYELWPVNGNFPTEDITAYLATNMNTAFITGFKIGAPFIVFTLIFYTGIGLLSRLMPQLNIFFLSLPLQIYLGLGLLFIACPVMIIWFCHFYEDGLMQLIK